MNSLVQTNIPKPQRNLCTQYDVNTILQPVQTQARKTRLNASATHSICVRAHSHHRNLAQSDQQHPPSFFCAQDQSLNEQQKFLIVTVTDGQRSPSFVQKLFPTFLISRLFSTVSIDNINFACGKYLTQTLTKYTQASKEPLYPI